MVSSTTCIDDNGKCKTCTLDCVVLTRWGLSCNCIVQYYPQRTWAARVTEVGSVCLNYSASNSSHTEPTWVSIYSTCPFQFCSHALCTLRVCAFTYCTKWNTVIQIMMLNWICFNFKCIPFLHSIVVHKHNIFRNYLKFSIPTSHSLIHI